MTPRRSGGVAQRRTRPRTAERGSRSVKLASRIVHKTEKGGVHLNVDDEAAVRGAFEAIGVPRGTAVSSEEGCSSPMVGNGVEVKVSMVEDPSFGPLIVFGLGGIHVEMIADVSVRVTPLTDRAAAAMVGEIRGLSPARGLSGTPARRHRRHPRRPAARLPPRRGGARYRGARGEPDLRGTPRRGLSDPRGADPRGAGPKGTGCPVHYGVARGPRSGRRRGREYEHRRSIP